VPEIGREQNDPLVDRFAGSLPIGQCAHGKGVPELVRDWVDGVGAKPERDGEFSERLGDRAASERGAGAGDEVPG
jgi:hypothetical protein